MVLNSLLLLTFMHNEWLILTQLMDFTEKFLTHFPQNWVEIFLDNLTLTTEAARYQGTKINIQCVFEVNQLNPFPLWFSWNILPFYNCNICDA